MSEQKKGVQVLAIRGTNYDDPVYEDGAKIYVQDEGHLYVADSASNTIAIYPPGKWHKAEVLS